MSQTVCDNISHELPYLWRFAIRLTRSNNIAEDLVQKTAVRALERREQFQPGSSLRSWLYSIMHSIWKNELRAEAVRQQAAFSPEEIDLTHNLGCQGESQQLFSEVVHQVNRLPEAQRTVVLLVCVEGYSYQEAATILDVAIGTIMSRLARARMTIGETFLDRDVTTKNPSTTVSSDHEN